MNPLIIAGIILSVLIIIIIIIVNHPLSDKSDNKSDNKSDEKKHKCKVSDCSNVETGTALYYSDLTKYDSHCNVGDTENGIYTGVQPSCSQDTYNCIVKALHNDEKPDKCTGRDWIDETTNTYYKFVKDNPHNLCYNSKAPRKKCSIYDVLPSPSDSL